MEPAPDEVEVEGRRRDRVEISHLKELYRKAGFSVGPSKLLALARQKGRDINLPQLKQITLAQVREFLASQPAFQIHQPGTRNKLYSQEANLMRFLRTKFGLSICLISPNTLR